MSLTCRKTRLATFAMWWLLALVVTVASLAAKPARALAGVDDYPANLKNAAQDALVDPWRFYNRECTSFVAWRLNNRNGVGFNDYYGGPQWGNANHWDDAARAVGVPVNNSAAVGSVAQTDAGSFGHVAWVESVNAGGTVTVEDYNHDNTGHYGERTVATSTYVYIHVRDMASGPPPDGSFVTVQGNGEVYRIVGGAPLYVSSWNAFGGPQPTTTVTADQINAMAPVPRDGTFVASEPDGRVYRIAGGAPLYVSSWNAFGSAQPTIVIDQWDIDNVSDPHAHLRTLPADGTFVNSTADGRVYRIAGGAPLYVSTWDAFGGAQPTTAIDQWDIDNAADPHAHLHALPQEGSFVNSTADGRVYEIAGGAPLYVSTWAAVGGPHPSTGIDQWDIDNATDPHAHLHTVPADGTFINTSTGHVYRIAGGATFAVSSWSVYGGQQPYVSVDDWDVANLTDPHAHLRATPADGEVVVGLPSQSYWSFAAGYRGASVANQAAVGVDDLGLAAYPVNTCPAGEIGTQPNCKAPPPPIACPAGQTGAPPNCEPPQPPVCPAGQTGAPPTCHPPTQPQECPMGQTGAPPNCQPPQPPVCPTGQTGAPPTCHAPTQPQTCPKGQTRAPAGCHAAPVKSPCTVAKLVGKTLPQAARLLIHAGCRVGHVIRPPARATGVLRVTKQAQPAGRHLPTGTYVGLAVAYRRR